jgi:outer membrane protein assembly factor BamB
MIGSSLNFPTPKLPKLPKASRAFFSKLIPLARVSALVALSVWVSACCGRNIHKDLSDDTNILVRKWTLQTHGPFDAGDHGVGEYSNPVLVDNTLIFGNQSVGLVALYPKINQQRWVLPIPGGVISELAVEKGAVYFGGGDGFLYSVNLENGRVNWRYDLRNPFVSRPTISGGRLFLTTADDTVYAFDAGTGKWLWHYRRRSSQTSTILGSSSPLVDGNEVLAGLSDGFVVALSLQEGQLKWERKLHNGTKFTDVDAHPTLDEGVIYLPSYDGSLYSLRRSSGDILWRFDAGGSKRVTIENGRVFLPSSDGNIYALQKSNAKILWKFELDKGVPTQLVITDKYVIAGSSHQYLYVIDKETGKGLYRYNAGQESGFLGAPAFDPVKGRLYVLSQAGNLYSFEVRKPLRKIFAHGQTDPYKF